MSILVHQYAKLQQPFIEYGYPDPSTKIINIQDK